MHVADDVNIFAQDTTHTTHTTQYRFSRDIDSKGRKLTEAQQEYFKDSKARNEDIPAENVKNSDYSYNTLTAKEKIKVLDTAKLGLKSLAYSSDLSRIDILKTARENIAAYNKANGREYGDKALYIQDLGAAVEITREGLKHGFTRLNNNVTNATVAMPAYFENAVVINEADGKRKGAEKSYILASMYEDVDGTHIARLVVNKKGANYQTNEYEDYLCSARTKKEDATRTLATGQDIPPITSSEISITQLLYAVKEYYPNELSADVAAHLEYKRGTCGVSWLPALVPISIRSSASSSGRVIRRYPPSVSIS